MILSPQKWRATLTVLACGLLGLVGVLAQQISPEYLKALATVYSGGAVGGFIKDWCDERAPKLKAQNAKALEGWRKKMELPAIDARLIEMIGDGKAQIDAGLEEKRADFYAQLDGSSQDAAKDCLELEKSLNEDFNLKVLYPEDYKVIAANAKKSADQDNSDPSGSNSSGKGLGQASSSNAITQIGLVPLTAKLPNMPAFDYATFVKTKLDPEREPIPDEYVCWGNIVGEAYKTAHLRVQILPGRKYRAAYGSSTTEGSFAINDSKLNFKTGAFSGREMDRDSFEFTRSEGSSLNLYDPLNEPGAEGKRYYTCSQRGLLPWKLLEFQRKDPQPGKYACIKLDGKASGQGTLEILPKRRYRYDGQEGAYSVDITGKAAYATVSFSGRLEDIDVTYAADTLGRQTFGFDQDTPVQCARSLKAQPVPKFATSKAPPAPGKGALEGRYYYSQTNFNGANMIFWFYFFQKDGYVYTDDATDTEGLMDIDCTKTYPSGIPLCEPYSVKGDELRIGNNEPVKFKRIDKRLEIDGRDCSQLESADGLKLNAIYESTSGQSNAQLYFYNYWSSEIEFKTNGSFFQAESSKSGNVVTDNSTYRPESGTYRIYGNTLEFKFKDGSVVRKFLIVTGGRKDLKYIHIGGVLYWIKDEQK